MFAPFSIFLFDDSDAAKNVFVWIFSILWISSPAWMITGLVGTILHYKKHTKLRTQLMIIGIHWLWLTVLFGSLFFE